jgi:hypothetical protein
MITTQAIYYKQKWIGEPQIFFEKKRKRKCDLGWTKVEKKKAHFSEEIIFYK